MKTKRPTALVLGAGGFIGAHLVARLRAEGYWVRGVDLKHPSYGETEADEFVIADLGVASEVTRVVDRAFDEVYQLAADMGGAGYIFTGEHDAEILRNSALINLQVLMAGQAARIGRIFYASSACVYPSFHQEDPDFPRCDEASVYPANPDSEYGWEKLFSERLYLAHGLQFGMQCRIARYHNIFGPLGSYAGGKEKAPAALARKVALAKDGSSIEIWGDGQQTRSFLYIDECIEGTLRLMRSSVTQPVNIGSEEKVTINQLAEQLIALSGKSLTLEHVPGPQGVRGRCSNNRLIRELLGWAPSQPLLTGLQNTYAWIDGQVSRSLCVEATRSASP